MQSSNQASEKTTIEPVVDRNPLLNVVATAIRKTEVIVSGGVLYYSDLDVSMEEKRSLLEKYK